MAAFIFDDFSASMAAEQQWELAGVEPSEEAFIAANQYLIDTGLAWKLQGFFGRQAKQLIDAGLCSVPETVSIEGRKGYETC